MGNQDKYLATHLPDHIHRVLLSLATAAGVKPDEMASQLLIQYIDEELSRRAQNEELPVEQQVFLLYQRSRRAPTMRLQLLATAQQLHQSHDEHMAEDFEALCLLAGFEAEDIMRDAAQMLNLAGDSTIVLDPSSQIGNAQAFLVEVFRKAGTNSLPMQLLENNAQVAGISVYSLRIAKKRLGMRSVRHGRIWHWELQAIQAEFSSVSVQ